MSTYDTSNPLSFIFGAKPGAGVPTYEQLQMRRKIAESLLGQKSRYPKTFGEGLGAIGEAIGERGMMNRLDAMESAKAAQDAATLNAIDNPAGAAPGVTPPTARPMSYAPEDAGAAPAPLADAAATGYRPAPAYLQAALAGSGLPPERQAYLGHLAGKEAQSAGEVSPTGATGPFQFIRSTGKQYGLVGPGGDKRSDITASITAASKLTDDNAATLRAGLGREPTPGELALAHQQGAGTAVKMLRGTGNAPAYNLSVNNAGGLGGPAAAQKIMKYYGMPGATPGPQSDAGPVVDPGLNQSVALNQTEPPAPPGPPMAFSGQPASDAPPVGMPVAGQPPPPTDARGAIAGAITPKLPPVMAPPVPPAPAGPQIAQAPPPQQPQIRVPESEPTPPPAPTATDKMRRIEKALATIGDPLQRDVLTKRYQQEWLDQTSIYNQKLEDYKHKRDRWESAPERARAARKADQEYIKTSQEMVSDGSGTGAAPPGAAVLAGPDPRLGTPQSPQRSGIPEIEPIPVGAIPKVHAEAQQKRIEEQKASLDTAKPALRESLDLMDKIRTHPSKDASIGFGGGLAQLTASGRGFMALHDQLKGKNLVEAYKLIKGTGQVGQKEGENVAKSQAALDTATTKEDYDKALNTLESTLRGAVERTERKLRQPVTAYQRTPDDPYAPDIGQIDDTWRDGKVREYIGGDPRDKQKSWKIIR